MASIDYGVDLSCTTDLNPLLIEVTGSDLMAEVCLRRLFARPGSDISNPVDNTLDVRDFLSTGIASQDLPRIAGLCQGALLGDQRVFTASVSADFDTGTRTLTLGITGTGAFGPFNLTVSVNDVTVELLRS